MKPVNLKTKCRRKLSGHAFHENKLVDTIMRRRGVYAKSRMEYSLRNLEHFNTFKDIEKASKLVADAIMSGGKIMVLADYDCDGATACATMIKSLRMLGAKHACYAIPDRFTMGYGTTPDFVDSIAHHKPDLVITVDNGISSFDGIERIREVLPNTKILVTDHHMASKDGSLPDADAIVNPNQQGCEFPSKAICGCGVAWYVGLATRAYMREKGMFARLGIEEPNLATLIDLVALGTVADVVPLDYNNRVIVDIGIKFIREGFGCHGINSLIQIGGQKIEKVKSSDFAFSLGPRINSVGRLDNMRIGVLCLLAEDISNANMFAKELTSTNNIRKDIQKGMVDVARNMVEKLDDNRLSIVVHHPEFNEGVIGLTAARLKESYGVPTYVFATNEKGMLKASGRSVPGFHLFDALNEIQQRHNERNGITERKDMMFAGFGGHAMAAGLSLKPEYLDDFTELLDEVVRDHLKKPSDVIDTDGLVDAKLLTDNNVKELLECSPFGQHFPEPILETKATIKGFSFSKNGRHLFYTLSDGERTIEAVAFNYKDREHLYNIPAINEEGTMADSEAHLVFRPDISEFRGQESFKMILESAKIC